MQLIIKIEINDLLFACKMQIWYVDIITLWHMHAHTCTYITSHITYVCTYCNSELPVNTLKPYMVSVKNLEMLGSGLFVFT